MPNYSSIIKQLQIEITTYCNAFCPGCGRNEQGAETISNLKLQHMDFDVWKKLINDDHFLEKISLITLNGMFGDPLMHPRIYEMVDLVPKNYMIEINTNGSIRDANFWSDFGKLLSKYEYHRLIWGVDGLQDTNHIHRRGTKWENIITNLQAFNNAGGKSEWRMTVFEHNKHQLVEAKKLSQEYGCVEFSTRESYEEHMEAKPYKNMPAQTYKKVDREEIDQILNGESNRKWNKPEFEMEQGCAWLLIKSLQITSDGKVWPCCYTAEEPYHKNRFDHIWTFPAIPNDLSTSSLKDILECDFYTEHLDQIWNDKKSRICNECIYGNPEGEV